MIRFIYLVILCQILVFGSSPICVEETFTQLKTTPYQEIFEDKDNSFTPETILKAPFETSTRISTQATRSSYWLTFSIKNCSSVAQNIVIQHPRAGLDFIDVYLFKGSTPIAHHTLGDMREQSSRQLLYRKSLISQVLEPEETHTYIIHLKSYGAYELYWLLATQGYFLSYNSIETFIWGIFGGVLLALAIYNLLIFISLKDKAYLAYSFNVLSLLWYQLAFNGILYQYIPTINLTFLTVSVWIVPYLALLCNLLFVYYFFQLQNSSLGKIFYTLSLISLGCAFFFTLGLWDQDILYFSNIIAPFTTLMPFSIIAVGIYKLFKRAVGSLFFCLAQGTYTLGTVYFVATTSTVMLPNSTYSWLSILLGITFDFIFLSLALGQKMQNIKNENEQHQQLALEQSRFSSIGRTVGNITHQWKTPLSNIASQFMYLQATFSHNKSALEREFEQTMPQIIQSIDYMKENLDMFHNFYTNNAEKSTINPKKEIDVILKILETKLISHHIEISSSIAVESITTHKSALVNLLMILLENAIDALSHKENERKISISIVLKQTNVHITLEDNAGGIAQYNLDKVFVSQHSTKANDGCGLGLNIAQLLTQKKLGGTLMYSHKKEGVLFEIVFPQEALQ